MKQQNMKTIKISKDNFDIIARFGIYGDTFDTCITKLLSEYANISKPHNIPNKPKEHKAYVPPKA
jgi:hypothetical protein